MNARFKTSKEFGRLCKTGFTLVEVLVSMTVLIILLLISAQVIGTVQSTWSASNARVNQFREARTAFDIITRNLSQATLNSYVDYDKNYLGETALTSTASTSASAPSKYLRKSDLRFVCGPTVDLVPQSGGLANAPGHAIFFQAPLGVAHNAAYVGLDRLLCGRGYFVQYTSDAFFSPSILPSGTPRFRYRLMEFSPPAEQNLIYSENKDEWFANAGAPLDGEDEPNQRNLTRPIADNIVALIVSPIMEGANQTTNDPIFEYDSLVETGAAGTRTSTIHRLPPLVRVVLVAIDEKSAERLSFGSDGATPPFETTIAGLIQQADPANLNAALEQIADEFITQKVNYRIFSSTVTLRGAKTSG